MQPRPGEGAAMFNMHTLDNVFGAFVLILTGQDADVENDFWLDLLYRFQNPHCRLPYPPLEISVRPLFFSIFFKFVPPNSLWRRYVRLAVSYTNGIGLAVIARQQGEKWS
jgi:hypothetical protein